jgi:hypothetical protein
MQALLAHLTREGNVMLLSLLLRLTWPGGLPPMGSTICLPFALSPPPPILSLSFLPKLLSEWADSRHSGENGWG